MIVNGRLEQRSYETQQGEKRSVVEIIADEIGPSLRWATANVVRNERRRRGRRRPRPVAAAAAAAPSPTKAPAAYEQQLEEPF